jgi:outer membrane protein OmpA-like peptidoglycan-associated protein
VAAAPTPPEPAKVEAPKASAAPAVDCGKLVGGVTVRFATGSAALTPDSRATLDRTLGCVTDASYEVAGHTDSVGNAAANLTLSKARADAVVAYLRTQGLDTSRMTTVGFGQTRPIADNATEEGRAQNRRISFVRRP